MMRRVLIAAMICVFLTLGTTISLPAGVPDEPFVQEVHKPYPLGSPEANDVRAVAVDRDGQVWAATGAGLFRLEQQTGEWLAVVPRGGAGPVFDVASAADGGVWAAAWNGVLRARGSGVQRVAGVKGPIGTLCVTADSVLAFGPDGLWVHRGRSWDFRTTPFSKAIRAALVDANGVLWLASPIGLYRVTNRGWQVYRSQNELLSAAVDGLALSDNGTLWVAGLGGVTLYRGGRRVGEFRPADGLPTVFVRTVARGPDGRMWVGTTLGVTRFDGKTWSLRHSRRWLLSDDVRDVAFGPDRTAWVATAEGVSAIVPRRMTLAEKAAHFHHVCYRRHVREPYLVEQCYLPVPGDTSQWKPIDTDNDGLFTGMYLAMESFRYATTGDTDARERAKKAFHALRYLRLVTDTPGFVARTVIPSSWTDMADRNRTYTEQEWAEIRVRNPRQKRVEKRWRLSKDGKWLWKGDTSSDEITGHMFAYHCYYKLAADEAERKLVREQVCAVMDYIIDGGFVLRDIDGKATKWAVWSPEKLNDDPDWVTERGVNSVEILAYLKLAYHVSGNEKYQRAYLKLLHEHHYDENVRHAKTVNPAWRTHIDDNLLAQSYLILFDLERDPQLRNLYRESIDWWYAQVRDDQSPFFDFVYAACTGQEPAQLDADVFFFHDTPLDLVRWTIDNMRREDVRIVHRPEMEAFQTDRLLPPSERGLMRWDRNPWKAKWGTGGRYERPGTSWLLPYWMGRYYGWIGDGKR